MPPSIGCARRACRRPPRRPAASPPRASSASGADGTRAAVVEVNSETDFVARNDQFQGLVKMIAHVALQDRRRGRCHHSRHPRPPAGSVADAIASVDRHHRREHDAAPRRRAVKSRTASSAATCTTPSTTGLGKIGVLVALESTGKTDELAALGRMVAMHVAATNPLALDFAGLDPADRRPRAGDAR